MVITDWNNFIATDNFLTNLPISQLSSIPMAAHGMGPKDLLLISRPCEPSAMTDTGYMSYKTKLGDLSRWMYLALDISGIEQDLGELCSSVGYLWRFKEMLEGISNACPSAVVEVYDGLGRFNPFVISAIYTSAGTILSDLGGYRFSDAMSDIFGWRKFNSISAAGGYFDSLSSNDIKTNTFFANTFNATNITADNGKFTRLTANAADITTANINAVDIVTADITTVDATNVTADNGRFIGLTANAANINNLTVDGRPY